MKIGYFVPEFPNQTHAFFWREAMALEESGMSVVFFSTRRPPDGACPHAFGAEARARTHYVFPPATGPALRFLARRPLRLAAAFNYVAGLSETPLKRRAVLAGFILCAADLALSCRQDGIRHVHFHSCADAAHIGALVNILDGITYSLTLHGDLPVYGKDHGAKMGRAALVTTVTTPLAKQVAGVIPGRTVPVIWMGVEMDRFTPPEAPKAAGGTIHAVTIARLNLVKGHRFFLEAMARAKDEGINIRYSIAGDGPYRAQLEKEIAQFGLEDRVDLLGAIPQDRVLALLREADLFALTSIGQGEAAPVAVMEAMACGVPVICSRIGGTADMINDDVDGFLTDQQDVTGIMTVLRRLAREDGLAARVSAAARERALNAFDHHVKAAELKAAILTSATVGAPT
jgi:glycosyltransferase involved in cell wall biosynthesis